MSRAPVGRSAAQQPEQPKTGQEQVQEPSKALAPAQSTALATSASLDALAGFSQAGMSNLSMRDLIMPRIGIIQSLSPQLKKNKPEYIAGAEEGMMFNAATRQLMKAMRFLPVLHRIHYIEWKPNRGGFVADHGDSPEIEHDVVRKDEKGFEFLPNGNIISRTPTLYGLNVEFTALDDSRVDAGLEYAIIPCPRTLGRSSRALMSLATRRIAHPERGAFVPPLFYRAYELTGQEVDNGENSWFIYGIDEGPTVLDMNEGATVLPANAFEEATKFLRMLESGEIKASAEHFDTGEDAGGSGGGSRSNDGAM